MTEASVVSLHGALPISPRDGSAVTQATFAGLSINRGGSGTLRATTSSDTGDSAALPVNASQVEVTSVKPNPVRAGAAFSALVSGRDTAGGLARMADATV